MSEQRLTFGKLFWPSFLAVFIAGLVGMVFFFLVLGGVIGSFADFGPEPLALESRTVLHLKLEGEILDVSDEKFNPTSFQVDRTNGLPELLMGIEQAMHDSNIKGLFLEVKNPSVGMASAQEIRDALLRFRKSGKFVVAYLSGELVSQGSYYIASAATEVLGFAASPFQLTGLHSESLFFKTLLDELHIGVTIVRGKDNDFKSAVEPFFRTEMSDSSRKQTQVLLSSLWRNYCTAIADTRKIDTSSLQSWTNQFSIRKVADAAKYGLVDQLMYRHEVLAHLKKKVGLDAHTPLRLHDFSRYARDHFYDDQLLARQRAHIAVILAEGDVATEGEGLSTTRICKLLQQVRDDADVKAVVFRINSPGGSALASEEIWKEVSLTAQKKKLIVSMGDVAASGGYYIATPAAKIFAQPMSITGSIGVFGMIPYTGEFLRSKLGITTDEVMTNAHGAVSLNHALSPTEFAAIQTEVDAIYTQFKMRVSNGRHLSPSHVQTIARGRVWTGADAKKIGLIDEWGGLYAALQYAQKSAKCSSVVYYPKKERRAFDELLNMLDDEFENESKVKAIEIPKELLYYYQQLSRLNQWQGLQMRMPMSYRIF
ncbi:MAG: signal peptide peptidase SppA [Bacteroidota bacterium]|jgi:protease-4